MVALRLLKLINSVDLTNVTRILDIGSWHLLQSIEFASIFSDARIDAFEPVPNSFEICKANLNAIVPEKRNRIAIHNLALSNVNGSIPFFEIDIEQSSHANVGASSMLKFIDGLNGTPFNQNLIQKEIEVPSSTLDSWCVENGVEHIDIMWVDIQGAELLLFQGAEKILSKTRIIMTEAGLQPYYEGHTLKDDIDSYLFKLGFEEIKLAFEINVTDYEANVVYINTNFSK